MFLFNLCILMYIQFISADVDYYKLLEITKSATNQEIRRAFKKLAITLHPDKNKEPGAQEKFVQITRAYEVLKDAEKRRNYDIHGEDTNQSFKPQYHSYTYYRDQFGIYDDDPHIVTFSASDFESSVENSDAQWFINFYSPICSVCHKLAPTWRSLAEELHGAVFFGAVNCEEEWSLCQKHGIHSIPTLILFPENDILRGNPSRDELVTFILRNVKSDIILIETKKHWNQKKDGHNNWILMLSEGSSVPKEYQIIAGMLYGLLGTAVVRCDKVPCEEWKTEEETSLIYLTKSHDFWSSVPLKSSPTSSRDVVNEVIALLPHLNVIDENKFRELIDELQKGSVTPWLLYFHIGPATELDEEVKRLPPLLPKFNLGRINCGRYANLCADLSISRYPIFAVFKSGGGWEFYHGSNTAHGIAAFAKDSAAATNLRTIGDKQFLSLIRDQGAWFVDFYAPWCPPCIRLLPQLRKASLAFSPNDIKFATVDCTIHQNLCAEHNVRSYPTTMLFNSTRRPQSFRGHSASNIIEFVENILRPLVIQLNYDSFYETLGMKRYGTIWMVGYFMPWCGPCQQLAPQYRKLAKMVSDMPVFKIAEVNCEEEGRLCQERGIRSYPHIEVHLYQNRGLGETEVFTGFQRDAFLLRRWLFTFLPSSIIDIDPARFTEIQQNPQPWLIDFFAPWCGHCVAFEPDFKMVAMKLEEKGINMGKVNCEMYPGLCREIGISGYPTVKYFDEDHSQGVEISSQNPQIIINAVEQLMKRDTKRFSDEL